MHTKSCMSEQRHIGALRAITDVIISLFPKHCLKNCTSMNAVSSAIEQYLQDAISLEELRRIVKSTAGLTHPIDELEKIMKIGPEPLPIDDTAPNARKKNRQWSTHEDHRLLAGILRNGMANWTAISKFIGNGRTRSQCSQRWHRGLDPRICKDQWTREEEVKLVALVRQYGDASWTNIASKMGNRSDVQCRYRYRQIMREETMGASETGSTVDDSSPASPNETTPTRHGSPEEQLARNMGRALPQALDAQIYSVF